MLPSNYLLQEHYMSREVYIFDLDGTLNTNDGVIYHKGEDTMSDGVKEDVFAVLQGLERNFTIFIMTGRRDTWRKQTVEWLQLNDIRYSMLFMRPKDSPLSTIEYKLGVLESLGSAVKVRGMFDDRADHAIQLRAAGYTVFDVMGNDFSNK